MPWLDRVDFERRSNLWVGQRPLTADGLPVIGALEDGLYVATGHGMFGVTLALPSGDVLAREILGSGDRGDLTAFTPNRAAIRGAW